MKDRIALFALALWWGSLTTLGAVVVPMLFAHLGTPATAGQMAARLFAAQTWVSVACVIVLLMAVRARIEHRGAAAVQAELLLGSLGLLLALLLEFAVAPRIVARENLRLWHAIGTGMFALQWLCAAVLLWRAGRPGPVSPPLNA